MYVSVYIYVYVCVHMYISATWLVVWVLWHVKLSRYFNDKSIFIQIISFISNNSV